MCWLQVRLSGSRRSWPRNRRPLRPLRRSRKRPFRGNSSVAVAGDESATLARGNVVARPTFLIEWPRSTRLKRVPGGRLQEHLGHNLRFERAVDCPYRTIVNPLGPSASSRLHVAIFVCREDPCELARLLTVTNVQLASERQALFVGAAPALFLYKAPALKAHLPRVEQRRSTS
jgi:hypothetical protein